MFPKVVEISDDDDETTVQPAFAPNFRPQLPSFAVRRSPVDDRQPLHPKQPDSVANLPAGGQFQRFRCNKRKLPMDDTQEGCTDRPAERPLQKGKRVLDDSDSDDGRQVNRPPGAARSLSNLLTKREVHISHSDEEDAEETANAAPSHDLEVIPATDDEEDPVAEVKHTKQSMRVDLTQTDDHAPTGVEALMAQAEEEEGEVDEQSMALNSVLADCEGIAARVRAAAGQAGADAVQSSTVTRSILEATCGAVAKYLKSYQVVGINFLSLLNAVGVKGAILADEMGLGKTCQVICYLGSLRHGSPRGPHLVVAPASVLQNWERELKMWCPAMNVVAYFGPDRHEKRHTIQSCRQDARDVETASESESEEYEDAEPGSSGGQERRRAAQHAAPFDVMLTCYTLFERDSRDQQIDRAFLRSWQWSHLVLDEAHAVKNRSSGRSMRLARLAQMCDRRIMLTGTPLQNDLTELHNLLRFLMPDLFQNMPTLESVQNEEEEHALARRMKSILAPFVIRRLKTEVADQLPAKTQEVRQVAMHPEQALMYEAAVSDFREGLAQRRAAHAAASTSEQQRKLVKTMGARKISNTFVHLRKIAQHPLLVRSLFGDARLNQLAKIAHRRQHFGPASYERVLEELQSYSDFSLHSLASDNRRFSEFCLEDSSVFRSGKCRLLAELLPALQANGSRPLIFSQWTQVLDVLEWLLDQLHLPYSRLDGSTAVADRQAIVDQFNGEPDAVFALLMTTRAGGQGLNLTGADTVILHDVDFNPQIDRQAEDRCHRLGQRKPVTIYRLVSKGTVDEGIHAMAQRKLSLDAAVLGSLSSGASADASPAAEASAMSQLLAALVAAPAQPGSAQNATAHEPDQAGPAKSDAQQLANARSSNSAQQAKAHVIELE